jgi:hypothetical protein
MKATARVPAAAAATVVSALSPLSVSSAAMIQQKRLENQLHGAFSQPFLHMMQVRPCVLVANPRILQIVKRLSRVGHSLCVTAAMESAAHAVRALNLRHLLTATRSVYHAEHLSVLFLVVLLQQRFWLSALLFAVNSVIFRTELGAVGLACYGSPAIAPIAATSMTLLARSLPSI